MEKRLLAGSRVRPLGLGCMNLNHGYSNFPSPQEAADLLRRALDAGVDHLDTATMYGGGSNEELIRAAVGNRRDDYLLASKCGLVKGGGGTRIDCRPASIRVQAEASLQRLGTDQIDLYYLHRVDPDVPIEDSVGALSELVTDGMIGAIGLSEVSAETLRRAHAVHPIAAVQTEYSLWTRNPELAVLEACRELGTTFVAFSPLGRAYLTGRLDEPWALPEGDMRHRMPRFSRENYPRNVQLLERFAAVAERLGATPAQLALAWVLAQGEHIVAIPGTTNPVHLEENLGAEDLELDAGTLEEVGSIINQSTVAGPRYNSEQQESVQTEEFAAA